MPPWGIICHSSHPCGRHPSLTNSAALMTLLKSIPSNFCPFCIVQLFLPSLAPFRFATRIFDLGKPNIAFSVRDASTEAGNHGPQQGGSQGSHLPPTTYHLSPITYHLSPTTYHLPPLAFIEHMCYYIPVWFYLQARILTTAVFTPKQPSSAIKKQNIGCDP